MRISPIQFVTVAAIFSLGCSRPEVSQISPGVYLISKTDKGGIFGNASKMKAAIIRQANEFAASKGKVAIPVSTHETPMAFGQFASFDYQFRLVDADSPEARSVNTLVPRPDVVIEKTEKITDDISTKDKTEKKTDLYTELTKLDDLRKKGLITDAEYDAEKKKLLVKN